MTVYVFVGPSLPVDEARAELDAVYVPPAAQGDVYRATLDQPRAIGLIDGYFERVPSVWHKEILWAMSRGIHVYGSASMGALRAAELAEFGMQGVGAVFHAFASGALEDDDEVAVAHGPAESGWKLLSEAMVNIRSTLARAEAEGVIGGATRAALEQVAKQLHYTERAYALLVARAAEQGLPAGELEALCAFLPRGRVDQKRLDAVAMLRQMRVELPELGPKQVSYSFAYTDAWDRVRQQAGRQQVGADSRGEAALVQAMLEDLQLAGASGRVRTAAHMRALALAEAERQGVVIGPEAVQATTDAFRRERGLLDNRAIHGWIQEQQLDLEGFTQLMGEEAEVRWVQTVSQADVIRQLPSYLRMTGEYGALAERTRDKQRRLAARGLDSPSLEDAGISEEELLRWYFLECLDEPVPVDLDAYARAAGFTGAPALVRAMLREHCYCRLREGELAGDP